MKKQILAAACVLIGLAATAQTYTWSQLTAAPSSGAKQDGIYFINPDTGWVVNGSGRIFRTLNGGNNWLQQAYMQGTFFRCVAFANDELGFAGNIGTNYFPGVTDTNPLYRTVDGGNSWTAVTAGISGAMPNGICAIEVVNENVIYAAGRVGTPQVIIKSTDGGLTWVGTDLTAQCKMILDIQFLNPDTGFVFAGTNANIGASNGRILRTTDGGTTWAAVYTSTHPGEIMWKASFPSPSVGYASIQSYNANTTARYVAKTADGGLTWTEVLLTNNGQREFGIGFIDENTGWVGCETTGFETTDGGTTWTPRILGQYANKFSVVKGSDGSSTCYAVGINVFKLTTGSSLNTGYTPLDYQRDVLIYPNPATSAGFVSIGLDKLNARIVKSELVAMDGKSSVVLFDAYYPGTRESSFVLQLPPSAPGSYIVKFTDDEQKVFSRKLIIR